MSSHKYTVNGVAVTDTLPPSWAVRAGEHRPSPSPNQTHVGRATPPITGAGTAPDPYVLAWSSATLGSMAENQEITITFTARTTAALAAGTLSRNRVQAVGTRTLGSPSTTQTFTATDFAYVASGSVQIAKTSSAPTPLYPGDRFTYTVHGDEPARRADAHRRLGVRRGAGGHVVRGGQRHA